MDFSQHINVVIWGFIVWIILAPKVANPRFRELFLAYMVALMLCLVGTSEIILVKPVPFFFTVGGALAFTYILLRGALRIAIRK